jgi:chromosomal replication initiation ATPase DnaA
MTKETILSTVERVFGVSRAELTGKRKHKQTSEARHCAAYFLFYHLNINDSALANLFKRSKTWASYVRYHFPEACETDKALAARANKVAGLLNAGTT